MLSSLPWLEVATVAAVFLIVAIAFRSLVAPLLALAVAGVAILLTLHIGGALAGRLGVPVPQETQPLLVALLLGVVTDYVVFYLSGGARRSWRPAPDGWTAARQATARFTPIIATAGATAAAGTGALIVAELAGVPGVRARAWRWPSSSACSSRSRSCPRCWPSSAPPRCGRRAPARGRRPAEPRPGAAGGRWARLLTRPLVRARRAAAVRRRPGRRRPAAAAHRASGVSFVEALPADHPGPAGGRRRPRPASPTASCRRPNCWCRAPASPPRQAELARLQQALAAGARRGRGHRARRRRRPGGAQPVPAPRTAPPHATCSCCPTSRSARARCTPLSRLQKRPARPAAGGRA